MEGVVPVGGPQDGPAPGQDPGHIGQAHKLHVIADQPMEPVGNAVNLEPVMESRLDHGPDHSVQTGTIASAGEDRQGPSFLFLQNGL